MSFFCFSVTSSYTSRKSPFSSPELAAPGRTENRERKRSSRASAVRAEGGGCGKGPARRCFCPSQGKRPSGAGPGRWKAPPRRQLDSKTLAASVARLLARDRIFTATEAAPLTRFLAFSFCGSCKTIEHQRALVLEGVLLFRLENDSPTAPRLVGAGRNWPQAPGVWSWAPPAATEGPLTHLELRTT